MPALPEEPACWNDFGVSNVESPKGAETDEQGFSETPQQKAKY